MLKRLKKYLPLTVGLVIIAIIATISPWAKIEKELAHLQPWVLFVLLGLSFIYYTAKIFRFWIMLRQLGIHRPLSKVAVAYLAAQPASLLPGGELYRTVLLEKYANVPAKESSPTVFMQGLVEAVVLLAVATIGSILLGRNQLIVIGIGVVLGVFLVAVKRGWIDGSHLLIHKLPFINLTETDLDKFLKANRVFLKRETLIPLVLLSIIPIAAGVAILYLAAVSIGAHLSVAGAGISYALPVVLSGLSFLPGGLGASEGSTIGLLGLLQVSVPAAIIITLLVRVFTLGAGLFFGLIAIIIANFQMKKL